MFIVFSLIFSLPFLFSLGVNWPSSVILNSPFEVFVNNTNLTFLSFLYKNSIEVSLKNKVASSWIWTYNTDHHWFANLMTIQLDATLSFLRHLDVNFVQKWQKCQICVIYENLKWQSTFGLGWDNRYLLIVSNIKFEIKIKRSSWWRVTSFDSRDKNTGFCFNLFLSVQGCIYTAQKRSRKRFFDLCCHSVWTVYRTI